MKTLIWNMHEGKAWGLPLSSLNVNKVLYARKRNVKLFVLSAFWCNSLIWHINHFYIKRKVINLEFLLIWIRERASFLKRVFFMSNDLRGNFIFWRKTNRNPSKIKFRKRQTRKPRLDRRLPKVQEFYVVQ